MNSFSTMIILWAPEEIIKAPLLKYRYGCNKYMLIKNWIGKHKVNLVQYYNNYTNTIEKVTVLIFKFIILLL